MKTTMCLCVIMITLWGCDNRSQELEKLQRSNSELTQDLNARDEYVDKVTESINNVYNSLESMQVKENLILKEKTEMEAQKKYSRAEIRTMLLDKIGTINTDLNNNRQTLTDLQTKVNSYKSQYSGLKKMVGNLKKTIEEREQSITLLSQRVQGLENVVSEKTMLVTQRDSVIDQQHHVLNDQYKQITTAYYITGTRDELEKMGIITKEGGFMWGLLGSSTTLASGFDDKYFKPINKVEESTIRVAGKINDIIPKRSEQFYKKTEASDGEQSVLTIAQPDRFWQEKYLVIITDRPGLEAVTNK